MPMIQPPSTESLKTVLSHFLKSVKKTGANTCTGLISSRGDQRSTQNMALVAPAQASPGALADGHAATKDPGTANRESQERAPPPKNRTSGFANKGVSVSHLFSTNS